MAEQSKDSKFATARNRFRSEMFRATDVVMPIFDDAVRLEEENAALKRQRDDLLKAAQYSVNMMNAFTKCPCCGFTENDRSGQRHSDDCPAAILDKAISKAEGD